MIFLAFVLNLCVSLSDKNCMVPENIHTYPREGYWKFQGEGGTQKSKSKSSHRRGLDILWPEQQITCTDLATGIYSKVHKITSMSFHITKFNALALLRMSLHHTAPYYPYTIPLHLHIN